ncbi:YkoF family thiamine/hydroxymethylpyrimidine-binding protein [Haloimpatiens sp. FM7330]|uniref:YkoF family thiamine/hydroxymethylpyrimidine-binding protein n=1 Tax=Haloimpatiens sp. FM7330 TaxID=3298610 RepID=UPI00363900E4
MIAAEVAIYPLKTNNASQVINNSINTLHNTDVAYSIDSMNTHLTGSKEEVFHCLQKMFCEAENTGGEINMVVTVTNASE